MFTIFQLIHIPGCSQPDGSCVDDQQTAQQFPLLKVVREGFEPVVV